MIVFFLMVMGNIPILYQKRIADATKKWREMKKSWSKYGVTGNWPDFELALLEAELSDMG